MRTCGKLTYGASGQAQRRCGSQIPGSDWVIQCNECQRRDAVQKAVNSIKPLEPVNPLKAVRDGMSMIDPLAKGVQIHSLAESGLMAIPPGYVPVTMPVTTDPNEAGVDRILARWCGIADQAISEFEHTHMSVTTADVRTVTDYIKFTRAQARNSNTAERREMSDSFLIGQIMRSLQQQGASYATAKTAAEDAVTHTKHYHGKDLFGQAWKKASEVAERLEPGLKITTPK